MKMTSSVSLSVAVLASAAMLVSSCSKSVTDYREQTQASTEKSTTTTTESLSSSSSTASVIGTYSLRGSRTQYNGQANNQGDNITVIFDYAGTRKVETSRKDKALTCGYCSDGFADKGWKYIIRIDPKTKQVLLSPNDKMLAEIKPGSFETLYAEYNPIYHSFSFQTRYTALDGNENEVVDLLNKQ